MDTDSSSYIDTTYSEDERIERALRTERRLGEEQAAKEDEARRQLFEQYRTEDLPIFTLPGLEFHTFRHLKIKFSFRPVAITNIVNKNVKFYISLKYKRKHWLVRRDSLPANYKRKVYRLFYDKNFHVIGDENLFATIGKIHEILVQWTLAEQQFRLDKKERYENGEDVEVDSDDMQIFFNEEERVTIYRKRLRVLKRMLPPKETQQQGKKKRRMKTTMQEEEVLTLP